MSPRRRMTLEEHAAVYRYSGLPLVDQVMALLILAHAATEEEERYCFLQFNGARDFTCADP